MCDFVPAKKSGIVTTKSSNANPRLGVVMGRWISLRKTIQFNQRFISLARESLEIYEDQPIWPRFFGRLNCSFSDRACSTQIIETKQFAR